MEDAENSLSSAAMTPRGRLRVDVPSPLARLILVPALPAFHARYPDIQIDMGVSDRVVDLIGDNVDCVLRGGQITDQSLIARHVGDLQIGVYVAPSYVERLGAPAHPRELQNTDHCIVGFLSSRTSKIDPLVLCSENERIEITGNYVLAVDDGNAYHEAGLVGLGVIALPNYMAAAHQAVGALIPLFTQWRISPMPLYLAFPPNRHVNAKLRVFIDWIVEVMLQHVPIANNQRRHPLIRLSAAMGFSGSDCGQACFDNRDSAELIRLIFWIMAIIKGIFAFMDNGSPKKNPQ